MNDETLRQRRSGDWCILRTSGARTLPLAKSLKAAGFDVWTPVQVDKRRLPRGRKGQIEREVPITPTFVFARADRAADLLRVLAMPVNPHPAFSVFRYLGRVPLIADREIAHLHGAEDRAKRVVLKAQRHAFVVGATVRVNEGAATGMSGIVEEGDGRFALVAFGGGFRMKIATFLLRPDEVQDAQPSGIAAEAA